MQQINFIPFKQSLITLAKINFNPTMACTACTGLEKEMLLNMATKQCFNSMETDHQDNLFLHLEFWQTWSNMQFAAFVAQSPKISNDLKKLAQDTALSKWKSFNTSDKGTPSYYLDKAWIANKRYWDPKNINVLWDDRLWLGVSYLHLYECFKVEEYLDVAKKLYQFILDNNDSPQREGYTGMSWKMREDYKNTITNVLFMVFVGRLYRITSEKQYFTALKKQYEILFETKGKYLMASNERKDGHQIQLFPDAAQLSAYWTYNQALPLQGLAQLIIYDDPSNTKIYVKRLCDLLNSIVLYFRKTGSEKFICSEVAGADQKDKTNCSIFRSYLFRHLICMKRLLLVKKPVWEEILNNCPNLLLFVKDNFQAMCKFQNCKPVFDWEDCAGTFNYYNTFNSFYVLYCGYELLNLEEFVVDGIELNCNNTLVLSLGEDVKSVVLIKVKGNRYGNYQPEARRELAAGANKLDQILGQDFCNDANNRNVVTLEVIYKNGSHVFHTLAHLETAYSQFAIIPDKQAHTIANRYGVRIKSDIKKTDKTYSSYSSKARQIILKCQQSDATKSGALGLYIT